MDINILSHEELLNYAQPETALEIKLFDCAKHFHEEAGDNQQELAQLRNEIDSGELSEFSDFLDDMDQVKAGIESAIEKIESGLIDEAKTILKDYV